MRISEIAEALELDTVTAVAEDREAVSYTHLIRF